MAIEYYYSVLIIRIVRIVRIIGSNTGSGEGQMMVRLSSGDSQVGVKTQKFDEMTLVDVKLVFHCGGVNFQRLRTGYMEHYDRIECRLGKSNCLTDFLARSNKFPMNCESFDFYHRSDFRGG